MDWLNVLRFPDVSVGFFLIFYGPLAIGVALTVLFVRTKRYQTGIVLTGMRLILCLHALFFIKMGTAFSDGENLVIGSIVWIATGLRLSGSR